MKKNLLRQHSSVFLPLALLVTYLLVLCIWDFGFYNISNIYGVVYAASLMVPAVIGIQILLVTGYFDLSTGSVAALVGVVAALIAKSTNSVFFAVVAGSLIGAVAGLFNALLVSRLKVHCLIATIATMNMWRGLALVANDGMVVAGLPEQLKLLARWQVFAIELPIVFGAVLFSVLSILCSKSRPFRRFYQVGSNVKSAKVCGLKIDRIVVAAFLLSALGASITGVLGVSRSMAASPTVNQTLALDTIAACVIGGSSLSGGRGTIVGAITGLIIIQITENMVILSGVSLYWRYFVIGVILALAVILDNVLTRSTLPNLSYDTE